MVVPNGLQQHQALVEQQSYCTNNCLEQLRAEYDAASAVIKVGHRDDTSQSPVQGLWWTS